MGISAEEKVLLDGRPSQAELERRRDKLSGKARAVIETGLIQTQMEIEISAADVSIAEGSIKSEAADRIRRGFKLSFRKALIDSGVISLRIILKVMRTLMEIILATKVMRL